MSKPQKISWWFSVLARKETQAILAGLLITLLMAVQGCLKTYITEKPVHSSSESELVLVFKDLAGQVPPIARVWVNERPKQLDPDGRLRMPRLKKCKIKCFYSGGKPALLSCEQWAAPMRLLDLNTEGYGSITITCEE